MMVHREATLADWRTSAFRQTFSCPFFPTSFSSSCLFFKHLLYIYPRCCRRRHHRQCLWALSLSLSLLLSLSLSFAWYKTGINGKKFSCIFNLIPIVGCRSPRARHNYHLQTYQRSHRQLNKNAQFRFHVFKTFLRYFFFLVFETNIGCFYFSC